MFSYFRKKKSRADPSRRRDAKSLESPVLSSTESLALDLSPSQDDFIFFFCGQVGVSGRDSPFMAKSVIMWQGVGKF